MIRKFAAVPGVSLVLHLALALILAAVTVHAQQSPDQQAPAQPAPTDQQQQQQPQTEPPSQGEPQTAQPTQPQAGQSSSQETEEIPARQPKPKGYKDWNFNVGGGGSLTNGATKNFVRSGGGIGAVGVAHNSNKYFGFRLDFQYDDLPLRASALQAAGSSGANDHAYTAMLGPIINLPVSKDWGGYIVGGVTFLHRSGELNSSSALAGAACNPFFLWWGHCFNNSLPLNGRFLHSSVNGLGEDVGVGVTRKIRPNIDFYAEVRLIHTTHATNSTDFRPITIGIRW